MLSQVKKILVIGGGFYGLYISEFLAKLGHQVTLVEEESNFMNRASYSNQARVHGGYHYPRSILTALRSKISLPKFVNEFEDCVDTSFDNYYMIAKLQSKVTSKQFIKFCNLINATCEPVSDKVAKSVNPHFIEGVFKTEEFVFSSRRLRDKMIERIESAGVKYFLGKRVESVHRSGGIIVAKCSSAKDNKIDMQLEADHVFNCTYSKINQVVQSSKLKMIPLKHEYTELALVTVPLEMERIGITVMDGPFFSLLPFPDLGLHSFSHVRYTPHFEWYEDESKPPEKRTKLTEFARNSMWRYMQLDAQRYIPSLSECKYEDSIWEVKTILPTSERDDSRPILFRPNYGIEGFHLVLGGKIDNVFDITDIISKIGLNEN